MKRILLSIFLLPLMLSAQVQMNGAGSYNENFDNLLNSGSVNDWFENSTIPNWYSQRTSTSTTYAASTGSSTAGGLYSFGSLSSSDRALGSIGSNNTASGGDFAHGVLLKNTGSNAVGNISLTYTLEQWRNGGTNNADTVTVWYKVSPSKDTLLNPGTNNTGWIEFSALKGISLISSTSTGALDGNSAANRITLSDVLPATVNPGSFIMIRWSDINHWGNPGDDGLAIDDVSISWGSCTPTYGTDVLTACDSLIWIDGNTYGLTTNTPTFALTNSAGCDSIVTLDLTVNYTTGGYLLEEVCAFPYTSTNTGLTYTQAGTIIIDSVNAAGCPHHETIDVVLNPNMFTTIINLPDIDGTTLLCYDPLVLEYQWYNCNTQQILPGENNDSLIVNTNGTYALIASYDYNCIDTSNCITIFWASLNETELNQFTIQPNPSNGTFALNFASLNSNADVTVMNLNGQQVFEKSITEGSETITLPQVSKGAYILIVKTSDAVYQQRIIIE
jgi:hypothetical protein